MSSRKDFLKSTGTLTTGLFSNEGQFPSFRFTEFESKRPPLAERYFTNDEVEYMIRWSNQKLQIGSWPGFWKLFPKCIGYYS